MNRLIKLYIALFILTTFNREMRIFGFDLRFLVVLLSLVLLFSVSLNSGRKRIRGYDEKKANWKRYFTNDLLIFYGLIFFSNVSWLWNGLAIDHDQFLNLVILNTTNFLSILIVAFYYSYFQKDFVSKSMCFSLIILYASMLWVYFGNQIPDFLMDPTVKELNMGERFVNAFGQELRVAGFAEDANIACLFSTVGIVISLRSMSNMPMRMPLFFLSLFCFAISFSKTLVLGFAVVIVCCFLRFLCKKSWPYVSWICMLSIVLASYVIIPNLDFLRESLSMSLRLDMWRCAQDVFLANPLFGGGLSSARAQMDAVYGSWYVQCHSTWWQILGEHGIVASLLFVYICGKRLSAAAHWTDVLLLVQLYILFINYELAFQQAFVFLLCMYPMVFFNANLSVKSQNTGDEERTFFR